MMNKLRDHKLSNSATMCGEMIDNQGKIEVESQPGMQLAMEGVNRRNREAGFQEIQIDIGIHTGKVVVGNLGSHKRMRYGLVDI